MGFSFLYRAISRDFKEKNSMLLMIVNSLTGNYYFQSYNGLKFF